MNSCDGDPLLVEDRALEGLILLRVLEDHTTIYQLTDLARSVDRNPEVFVEIDSVRNAVGRLARAGLLCMVEDLVLPSAPAAYFHALPVYM
jgi:hypothetical protein